MAKRRAASFLESDFLSMESNLDGLELSLDKFAAEIQEKVVMSGVARMALVIYDEVRYNASGVRATGEPGSPPHAISHLLQSAVYRMFIKEKSTETVKTYIVSVNKGKAPHWNFAEYGTSRQPAYPFIRPAFDRIGAAIEAGKERMAERLADGTLGLPT
jgi:HK97 gp10 family phage protein